MLVAQVGYWQSRGRSSSSDTEVSGRKRQVYSVQEVRVLILEDAQASIRTVGWNYGGCSLVE